MRNLVHTYWINGSIGITWKYFQNDGFGQRSEVSMHNLFTIKEIYLMVFRVWILSIQTRGMLRDAKKHEQLGDCFQLFESRLATPQVF